MPKAANLVGQRFGRLEVLEQTDKRKNQSIVWKCKCDCGNIVEYSTRQLKSKGVQSCGCLQKEVVSNRMRKDLTGQKFGKLTALSPTDERKHGSIVWKCKCDCGNIHYTNTEMLLSGRCQSCGCLHSKGNQKIKEILQVNKYLFVDEYPIRVNNINYYFDFAVLNADQTIKVLIEYDGVLHFPQDSSHGWNNNETWEKTKKNDEIKNQWCKDNNIPLLRIPYTDFDNLDINYLKERIEKLCIMD